MSGTPKRENGKTTSWQRSKANSSIANDLDFASIGKNGAVFPLIEEIQEKKKISEAVIRRASDSPVQFKFLAVGTD